MTSAIVVLIVLFLLALPAGALLARLDNRLEADVLLDPRSDFALRVHFWLGLDRLDRINHKTLRIEAAMTQVIDLLNGLIAQDTAASTAQATSFHNIDAAFTALQQAIANQGEATPEVQDAVNKLSAGFASLQKAAEDEGTLYAPPADNGGDTPVQPPADGGDTPPVDGGDPGDVPVVENSKR